MNTYVVEVPIKGAREPQYVICTSVSPDTENEAKREALESIRCMGDTPDSPTRLLIIRETDGEMMREESIRQFVGPSRSSIVPQLVEWLRPVRSTPIEQLRLP